ncbi:hypothetical protein ER308_09060 [Egibacter rhizosphaerae]|uniref:Uncharacterized protein n=1 Tax=Egibacter rhizosphaerae TaxID=1670831 RepID=A0A411YEY6_9ACTN|nr:hypothetical protein [Egibacter rhizosphaerae]QBI19682.1 hypothetical protein ER308_09060 [Egibacter rhizosphaerae]
MAERWTGAGVGAVDREPGAGTEGAAFAITRTTALLIAVGVWSVLNLVAGTAWAMGATGYPFVADPASPFDPLLAGLSAPLGAAAVATVGAVSLLAALAGGLVRRPGPVATAVVALLALASAATLLIVPGIRVLAAVAYTPLLLLGAPFDWPQGASLAIVWPWPVTYEALALTGGLLSAFAAAAVRRRATDGSPHPVPQATAATARRWGRRAVAVAVAVPLAYAATRYAWALGLPLGISDEVHREGQATGLWLQGAALASLAVAGAGLTLGLHQSWGETVPRWIPGLGGKTVPPTAATVPAFVVAALVTMAGLSFVRLHLAGAFDDFFAGTSWAVLGPELLWPVWGASLATAALAYHTRRQHPRG